MKINLSFFALLLPVIVVFSSCKKDKDDAPASYFTYDGKTYETKHADAEAEGEFATATFASVEMGSATSGKVSMVSFMFGQPELKAGTFTFKSSADDAFDATKNFFGAFAVIDFEAANQQSGTWLEEITAGTITIAKDGTNYNITYELNFDGKVVSGKYSGAIQ
jgi:hypothetical protein